MNTEGDKIGKVPVWVLAVLLPAAALVTLGLALGSVAEFANALVIILTDGAIAMLVLVAAGGYGWAVLRFFRPGQSPRLLCLATAAGLGLWMLSTAVLIVGSLAGGLLTMYLWWPVICAGVVLAAVQSRRTLKTLNLPGKSTVISFLWVLPAIAAGLWLAGATMPPGWIGNLTMDSYDVLEYHLQLPREYYNAGSVTTLNHNVYSHYPLGVEMLFLLGMCLRGGPYEGMHLGKLMVGLFSVITIVGVFGGTGLSQTALRKHFRGRAAAVLLATAPWMIYLSGLAMVEPAQFCYLALALLWVRQWLTKPSVKSAVVIGAMLGAACAVKYLSVGLIAGPVLTVMLIASMVRHRRRIPHVVLSAGMAIVLFSPWLIRNTIATANPVFPLATKIFGQGHFSDESAARWRDGHAPGYHRPVPKPADYKPPERQPSRSERFFAFVSGQKPYDTQPATGPLMLLACVAIILMFAGLRETGAWYWAIFGVLVMQVLVWMFFTHDMPARFLAPAIVPLSLLAACGLGRISNAGALRRTIAVLLLVTATGWNLASAWNYFHHPAQQQICNRVDLPGPTMLIGEARAFYLPADTVYATVFDEHPLAGILRRSGSPDEVADEIRRMGITHVWVSWSEIDRLSHSYGWPAEMSAARLRETFAGWEIVEEFPKDRPVLTLYSLKKPPDPTG